MGLSDAWQVSCTCPIIKNQDTFAIPAGYWIVASVTVSSGVQRRLPTSNVRSGGREKCWTTPLNYVTWAKQPYITTKIIFLYFTIYKCGMSAQLRHELFLWKMQASHIIFFNIQSGCKFPSRVPRKCVHALCVLALEKCFELLNSQLQPTQIILLQSWNYPRHSLHNSHSNQDTLY